jgi:hypothetical protein
MNTVRPTGKGIHATTAATASNSDAEAFETPVAVG